ncbi:MAG: hypothetical protein ACI8TA_002949, partial [Cyclobacteriaceae bacterium]
MKKLISVEPSDFSLALHTNTAMKKTLFTLLLSVLTLTGFTQSTELTARLNSGLFYYSGESVEG